MASRKLLTEIQLERYLDEERGRGKRREDRGTCSLDATNRLLSLVNHREPTAEVVEMACCYRDEYRTGKANGDWGKKGDQPARKKAEIRSEFDAREGEEFPC